MVTELESSRLRRVPDLVSDAYGIGRGESDRDESPLSTVDGREPAPPDFPSMWALLGVVPLFPPDTYE